MVQTAQNANPPANPPLDISASANEVTRLLNANQGLEAMRLLEQQRQGQPQAVQESLDRMVVARGGAALDRSIAEMGRNPELANSPELASARRVDGAGGPPRTPTMAEVGALNPQQRYDVYASIVETRGNDAAREDLRNGNRVILGLRTETSTLASATRENPTERQADNPATRQDESSRGTGVYDDRIVVLGRRDQNQLWQFDQASTEPTAQYSERAANGEYPGVRPRTTWGIDANGDGISDAGRMREGTIEMMPSTHPNPGPLSFAMMPSPQAVASGRNGIERDVNGDGLFNAADGNQRLTNLDQSFKIHEGSYGSTDSAGCQTLRAEQFEEFAAAARGNPGQNRWQYVLTETGPGQQQVQGGQQQGQPQDPQPPQNPRPQDPQVPQNLQPQNPQNPQPAPTPATGQPNPDPLRAQIDNLLGTMPATQSFSPTQLENAGRETHRQFSEVVDKGHTFAEINIHKYPYMVATVAPNGMGNYPMDNYSVDIEKVKDISPPANVAERQPNHEQTIAQNIEPPKKSGLSM
jgi:hypothetical protein